MINKNFEITNNPENIDEQKVIKQIERVNRIKEIIYYEENNISGPIGWEFNYIDKILKLMLRKITYEDFINL